MKFLASCGELVDGPAPQQEETRHSMVPQEDKAITKTTSTTICIEESWPHVPLSTPHTNEMDAILLQPV
jgi:hypothetical protein